MVALTAVCSGVGRKRWRTAAGCLTALGTRCCKEALPSVTGNQQ